MNVIVIMADSWRVDHFGCYGNEWIQTPNLDQFAEESCVFDMAFAEGLPTIPTRTSLFTGRYTFPFRGWQRLEHDDVLLAEVLWSSGYTSALIADTYHMHKPQMAFERGFDYVHFIRGQEGDPHILDESIQVDVDAYHKSNSDAGASANVRDSSNSICEIGRTGRAMKTTLLRRLSNHHCIGSRLNPRRMGCSCGWTASIRMNRGIRPSLSTGCISPTTTAKNSFIQSPARWRGISQRRT